MSPVPEFDLKCQTATTHSASQIFDLHTLTYRDSLSKVTFSLFRDSTCTTKSRSNLVASPKIEAFPLFCLVGSAAMNRARLVHRHLHVLIIGNTSQLWLKITYNMSEFEKKIIQMVTLQLLSFGFVDFPGNFDLALSVR